MSQNDDLHFHNLTVSFSKRLVKVDDEKITLTRKEFDLLCLLLSRPGVCFSRDELLESVWGYDFADSSRTVDVHIRMLRAKLKEAGDYIKTVRGVGYKIGDEE